jgi:hypothetical protein
MMKRNEIADELFRAGAAKIPGAGLRVVAEAAMETIVHLGWPRHVTISRDRSATQAREPLSVNRDRRTGGLSLRRADPCGSGDEGSMSEARHFDVGMMMAVSQDADSAG